MRAGRIPGTVRTPSGKFPDDLTVPILDRDCAPLAIGLAQDLHGRLAVGTVDQDDSMAVRHAAQAERGLVGGVLDGEEAAVLLGLENEIRHLLVVVDPQDSTGGCGAQDDDLLLVAVGHDEDATVLVLTHAHEDLAVVVHHLDLLRPDQIGDGVRDGGGGEAEENGTTADHDQGPTKVPNLLLKYVDLIFERVHLCSLITGCMGRFDPVTQVLEYIRGPPPAHGTESRTVGVGLRSSNMLTRMKQITCVVATMFIVLSGCSSEPADQPGGAEASSPDPAKDWYVLEQQTRIGPMTEARLRQEAAKGRYRTDEPVWSTTLDDWSTITEAVPDVEIGGTEDAGVAWARIFRETKRVPEPLIPGDRRSGEYTQSEIDGYLSKGRGLLQGMRGLAGRHGPEPALDPDQPVGRLGRGRQLARLLRIDIEQAVKSGDRERALQDIAAMCAVSRQMTVTRILPEGKDGFSSADDQYELSNLVALSVIRVLSGIIVNPDHAEWSQGFKDTATEHLQWVDDDLRSSFNPRTDVTRTPDQQAEMKSTRELLGFGAGQTTD